MSSNEFTVYIGPLPSSPLSITPTFDANSFHFPITLQTPTFIPSRYVDAGRVCDVIFVHARVQYDLVSILINSFVSYTFVNVWKYVNNTLYLQYVKQ